VSQETLTSTLDIVSQAIETKNFVRQVRQVPQSRQGLRYAHWQAPQQLGSFRWVLISR